MQTLQQAFYELKNKLLPIYGEHEATSIAHQFLEHLTGYNKIDRIINKNQYLIEIQQSEYETAVLNLVTGMPLQYVIGYTWFLGQKYYVNEQVLIPRPETEELIDWIINDFKSITSAEDVKESNINILDIGTGSGCIAISLKSAIPNAVVSACDISIDALNIAQSNSSNLSMPINFFQIDILNEKQHKTLPIVDIIVSNPPYIPLIKKETLHTNVKDFEPGIALFVPDHNPLVFYKSIAHFGQKHLSPYGKIYCELEFENASDCKKIFEDAGYKNVNTRKDMHGNWRMIKAEN